MKLRSAYLIDGSQLDFGDFNVFVGGNAVGKTTLIVELFFRASTMDRPRWFWLDPQPLNFASEDPVKDLILVFQSMSLRYEGARKYYYSQSVKNLDGNVDLDGRYRFETSEYKSLEGLIRQNHQEQANSFLAQPKYYRPFIAFANCESRLSLLNRVGLTPLDQPPQDAVNVLYRSRGLRKEIDGQVYSQFHLHLALLDHTRTQLDLGLSKLEAPDFIINVDDLQQEFSRIDAWKDEHFIPMQDVGHGIRSMIKLLLNLQDPVNQIVMIDEPEMHIYPAQKRWLGRQMVTLAHKQGKQVFIVTHDPIVLQGILDTPGRTRIFRIDVRDDGSRNINRCDLEHVIDVGSKRNQDSYLQGLFYHRSVIVEGAADRAFYQIMIEELLGRRIENKDLGFIACGGKGASKNVAHISAQVGLRTAIIFDFDALLFDTSILLDVTHLRGGGTNALASLMRLIKQLFGNNASVIKKGIDGADRFGFQSPFVQRYYSEFEQAKRELEKAGIFIVPNGSLESWAPQVDPKVRFPELAPDIIKKDPILRKQLKKFLSSVIGYVGC